MRSLRNGDCIELITYETNLVGCLTQRNPLPAGRLQVNRVAGGRCRASADVRYCSDSDRVAAARRTAAKATNGHDHHPFILFATSRALSMKSCTTGPSARFFSVTIPFDSRSIGNSTGNILMSERFSEKCNAEAGKTVR